MPEKAGLSVPEPPSMSCSEDPLPSATDLWHYREHSSAESDELSVSEESQSPQARRHSAVNCMTKRDGAGRITNEDQPPFCLASYTNSIITDSIAFQAVAYWVRWLKLKNPNVLCTLEASRGCSDFIRYLNDEEEFHPFLGDSFLFQNMHIIREVVSRAADMALFGGLRPPRSSSLPALVYRASTARRLSYDAVCYSVRCVFNRDTSGGYEMNRNFISLCRDFLIKDRSTTVFTNDMLNFLHAMCMERVNKHGQRYTLTKAQHPFRKAVGFGVFHGDLDEDRLEAAIVTTSLSEIHAEIPVEILSTLTIEAPNMDVAIKMNIITLCTLLCSILATYKTDDYRSDPRLMDEVECIEGEINRILKQFCPRHTGSFITFEHYPRHDVLDGGFLSSVVCGPDCHDVSRQVIQAYRENKVQEGLLIQMHGIDRAYSQESTLTRQPPKGRVPGENRFEHSADCVGTWGWNHEERKKYETTPHEDTTILLSGGSNIWMCDPPLIKLELEGRDDPTHHFVILRDRFDPLLVSHVAILSATQDLCQQFYPDCPTSTFFMTEFLPEKNPEKYKSESWAADKQFNMFRHLQVDLLISRLWDHADVVRCVTKRVCLDNKTIGLERMKLHFWMPLTWAEFTSMVTTHMAKTRARIPPFIRQLTMQDKLSVHFAICPHVEPLQAVNPAKPFSKYAGARSVLTYQDQEKAILSVLYSTLELKGNERIIPRLKSLFMPIGEECLLYASSN